MTYWPAGGGRGQNPENTAQGHSGHIGSIGTYRIVTRVPAARNLSTGRALWARPVRQGFCPRPPPAGQYVLYSPLTVYRISGMLYYYNTLEQYFRKLSDFRKF